MNPEANPIDPTLLSMLRCPITQQGLRMATVDELVAINQRIDTHSVRDASDEAVREPLDGGLISLEGEWLYPVRNVIPTLIPEEAIALQSLELPREPDSDGDDSASAQ